MFVGAVVYNQIHQNVHAALLSFCNQAVHIFHGAKAGVNVIIIGNIVALVCQRRAIARGKPDDIYAKILQVIQLLYNSRQIADSVTVCIVKALRVNLIGNLILPPFSFHMYILL